MSKIIIHVGTHKTATTTIQDTLFHNRALLAKNGIIIPEIGRSRGHHSLATEWINMAAHYQIPGGPASVWEYLVKTYAHQDKTVFISSEEFSRIKPKCVDMKSLRKRLQKFDEVEIICVLRNQVNFVQSVYIEISKNRNKHGLGGFIAKALGQKMAEGLWLDYNGLYDHIRTGFAADEIQLVSFESTIKTKGGIVGCFLDILGTDLTADDMKPFQDAPSNVSPEPLAVWAANVVTAPRTMTPKLLSLADKELKNEFGENIKTTLFTRNEIAQYSKIFEPLNRALERKTLPIQTNFHMAPVSIDANRIDRAKIGGTYWVKYMREIYTTYSKANSPGK